MKINEIFRNLKESWISIFKFAVFISGIVLIIIAPLPIPEFNNNTIRFFISLIVAFLIIPIYLFKKKVYFKNWLISSIITFITSIIFFVSYNFMFTTFVINYHGRNTVIGSSIKASAMEVILKLNNEDHETYHDGSKVHNSYLLSLVGGDAARIWHFKDIESKTLKLIAFFYLTILSATILILCLTQTLQILFSEY